MCFFTKYFLCHMRTMLGSNWRTGVSDRYTKTTPQKRNSHMTVWKICGDLFFVGMSQHQANPCQTFPPHAHPACTHARIPTCIHDEFHVSLLQEVPIHFLMLWVIIMRWQTKILMKTRNAHNSTQSYRFSMILRPVTNLRIRPISWNCQNHRFPPPQNFFA